MSLTRFRFDTWSRNRIHLDSGVEFSTFVNTFSQFLCYLCVVVGPASEQENLRSDRLPKSAKCVFFWFPRWFPKKKKKKEMLVACWIPLMNMNKSFSGIFGENMRSQTRPKWKQNKTKITSRLTDSFGNSMVHENILLSCNISFNPLLRKSSSRFLKCSERNWPMYSLLRLTLAQECKCIKEVLDNRAWIRILPSSVHDIFYTFKEIEFNSSRYIRIRKWRRIILFI